MPEQELPGQTLAAKPAGDRSDAGHGGFDDESPMRAAAGTVEPLQAEMLLAE